MKNMKSTMTLCIIVLSIIAFGCTESIQKEEETPETSPNPIIDVIFDTDANNELDDQHALAYLVMNGETFNVKGVTVNATRNGGNIEGHYLEAMRILELCTVADRIPLLKGADGSFEDIRGNVKSAEFDGSEAVDFIIRTAKQSIEPLTLIAVGKLTNVALALEKSPEIAPKIRLVWLGSNYPEPGEYNQENDVPSMNYLLETKIPFEMVTVRYGKPSGTDAVKVTQEEINLRMPGMGPKSAQPVKGRHGVSFNNFGDYSVNLFEHIDYYGDPPSRALFDMAAVAIVKNPDWAEKTIIPSPIFQDDQWMERPDNPRKIVVWENFDRDRIINDFYSTLENYVLVNQK
jgi:hypothetical protein